MSSVKYKCLVKVKGLSTQRETGREREREEGRKGERKKVRDRERETERITQRFDIAESGAAQCNIYRKD